MATIEVVFTNAANIFEDPDYVLGLKRYSYNCHDITDLEVGDIAVIENPSSGLTITRIVGFSEGTHVGNKLVVGTISLRSYREAKEREARAMEIRKQLERNLKARADIDRFRVLADDPASAVLLQELESLK